MRFSKEKTFYEGVLYNKHGMVGKPVYEGGDKIHCYRG